MIRRVSCKASLEFLFPLDDKFVAVKIKYIVTPTSNRRNKTEPILNVSLDFKVEEIIKAAQSDDTIAIGSLMKL